MLMLWSMVSVGMSFTSCSKDNGDEPSSVEKPTGPRDPGEENGGNPGISDDNHNNDGGTGVGDNSDDGDTGVGDNSNDGDKGDEDGVVAMIIGSWQSEDNLYLFTFEKSGNLFGQDPEGVFTGNWTYNTLHKIIYLCKRHGNVEIMTDYKCVVTDNKMTLYGLSGEKIILNKIS
ncbi:MAG: hypothetical protein ACI303_07730 [Lepagella sp.]